MRTDLPSPKNLADAKTGTGKCDRQLLAKLCELNKPVLKQRLGKSLTAMEIDGLLALYDRPARE